jgi:hypothetical protein
MLGSDPIVILISDLRLLTSDVGDFHYSNDFHGLDGFKDF